MPHECGGLGFEVIGAISLGLMPYSCEHCAEAPALKEKRGCLKPSIVPVWASDDKEYYSCPMLFANTALYDWRESYAFGQKFGGLQYDKLPSKWFDAWHAYESAVSRMQAMSNQKQSSGIEDLRRELNGR